MDQPCMPRRKASGTAGISPYKIKSCPGLTIRAAYKLLELASNAYCHRVAADAGSGHCHGLENRRVLPVDEPG